MYVHTYYNIGLDPNEVKYAQGEFKKFDMEGNGEDSTKFYIIHSE